jgi:antitoxin component YwqK of YwqJK toxin-antitoxin module
VPTQRLPKSNRIIYHKDESVWGKENVVDGKMDGYWERFQDESTRRSGSFEKGKQTGESTTYNRAGKISATSSPR